MSAFVFSAAFALAISAVRFSVRVPSASSALVFSADIALAFAVISSDNPDSAFAARVASAVILSAFAFSASFALPISVDRLSVSAPSASCALVFSAVIAAAFVSADARAVASLNL